MIKDKITMQDHLAEYWASVGGESGNISPAICGRAAVNGAFYAGAAAMASQFATNGILYIPNQSGSPDLDTGQSQGWVKHDDYQKLESALCSIRDFEPVTNGEYAVMEALPAMRKIAITALAPQANPEAKS